MKIRLGQVSIKRSVLMYYDIVLPPINYILTPVILSRFSVETGSFANLHSISAAKSENPQNFDKIEKIMQIDKNSVFD